MNNPSAMLCTRIFLTLLCPGGVLCASTLAFASPYFDKIHLPAAWQLSKGAPQIKVAILASKTNVHHSELQKRLSLNPKEYGDGKERDGIDNDLNGYIDDSVGVNTFYGTGDSLQTTQAPKFDLGTYLASLIVSSGSGVAPQSHFIPVDILGHHGQLSFESIEKGINYAIGRGARVILLAVHSSYSSQLSEKCALFSKAAKSHPGVIFIGASPHTGTAIENGSFPSFCISDNLLISTALDKQDRLFSWASYGVPEVSIAAPAQDIEGLDRLGNPMKNSSSFAASALVAGAAALKMSKTPSMTAAQLKKAFIKTATPLSDLQGKVSSAGMLNVYQLLKAEESP